MAKHLFVIDPLDGVRIDQDSSFGLIDDAQARGDGVWSCQTDGLFADLSEAFARCRQTTVRPVQGDHFTLAEAETLPLAHFDVIWMRKDPPFDLNYIAATYILELAPSTTRVVNRPDSLRGWNEKACVLKFPDLAPPCLLSRDISEIRRFQHQVGGSIVLKPLAFSGGAGIVALHPGDLNTPSLLEMSTRFGQDFILAQQYLPAIEEGDKRVIHVNGEARGALLRRPPADDLRGNIHTGASVELAELTDAEKEICERIRQPLADAGHLFAGIDLIGGRLTEINVTSPTGIQEIYALGGPNLAAELLDAALT